MPNRSSSMPKRGDQNVFVSGIFTCLCQFHRAIEKRNNTGNALMTRAHWRVPFETDGPSPVWILFIILVLEGDT
jgi:hypothetical protein